jgi:hypothetical protein
MISGNYTERLKAFIKLMLVVDKGMRPNIERLLKHKLILNHVGNLLIESIDLVKKRRSECWSNGRYSCLC